MEEDISTVRGLFNYLCESVVDSAIRGIPVSVMLCINKPRSENEKGIVTEIPLPGFRNEYEKMVVLELAKKKAKQYRPDAIALFVEGYSKRVTTGEEARVLIALLFTKDDIVMRAWRIEEVEGKRMAREVDIEWFSVGAWMDFREVFEPSYII